MHVAGVAATDLVHMGQLALLHEATVDVFIDNVFNFPTYGESFRVAALDAVAALNNLDFSDDELRRMAVRLAYSKLGFSSHKCSTLHGICGPARAVTRWRRGCSGSSALGHARNLRPPCPHPCGHPWADWRG